MCQFLIKNVFRSREVIQLNKIVELLGFSNFCSFVKAPTVYKCCFVERKLFCYSPKRRPLTNFSTLVWISVTSWQQGSLPFRSSRSRINRSKGDRDSVAGALLSLGSSDSIGPFLIDRLTWSLWKSSCKTVTLIWYKLRLGFRAGRLLVKKLPLFWLLCNKWYFQWRKKERKVFLFFPT